jgi:Rps23 Pro-64 3,4-dihydroxylase Tpa1-like proline 4-hydroxylase
MLSADNNGTEAAAEKFKDLYKNQYDLVEKLDKNYLASFEKNIDMKNYLGSWVEDKCQLSQSFKDALPFPHLVIDNFLEKEYAAKVNDEFPAPDDSWYYYCNPIEVKYVKDKINTLSKSVKDFFYLMSLEKTIKIWSEITGIKGLEVDPYLHGAGIHSHTKDGRLSIHLDYERHPLTGKKRMLNVILYINVNWNEDWNGHTELWDKDMTKCEKRVYPVFNRAAVFQTNDLSWHGLPEILECPEGTFRKSLAYYYVADFEDNAGLPSRTKATFVKRPSDPKDSRMQQLLDIRPLRRIEPKDMEEIWPTWTPDFRYN